MTYEEWERIAGANEAAPHEQVMMATLRRVVVNHRWQAACLRERIAAASDPAAARAYRRVAVDFGLLAPDEQAHPA